MSDATNFFFPHFHLIPSGESVLPFSAQQSFSSTSVTRFPSQPTLAQGKRDRRETFPNLWREECSGNQHGHLFFPLPFLSFCRNGQLARPPLVPPSGGLLGRGREAVVRLPPPGEHLLVHATLSWPKWKTFSPSSPQGERLYAVKLYKGRREFLQVSPEKEPPVRAFPLKGVHVKVGKRG